MEYPESDMFALFNKVGAKQIYAYSNENNELQDLVIGASGNVKFDTETFELTGDTIFNSNLVVNDSVYFGDVNIFRTYTAGHTISYGMRISDDEKLQFYKHDSRKNKSVVVNEFGIGSVADNNKGYTENTTGKLDGLFTKAKNVNRKTG
jgi:hypothetical protein